MRHELMATANAAAVVTAIVYVVCRLFSLVVPELFASIGRSWFHGIVFTQSPEPFSLGSFLLGMITATASAWVVGYLFAASYNYFVKK